MGREVLKIVVMKHDCSAAVRQIGSAFEELIRILSMQIVLAPAAYTLPRGWALRIANVLALLLVILPMSGMHVYGQMRRVYGKSRLDSLHLTWGWLARPFRDFVVLKRLLYRRENPFNWRIIEKNADGINSLRESGASYIVATGHFLREAVLSISSPNVTYGHNVELSLTPPKRIRCLYDLRMHIQFGTLLKAISSGCGRDSEFVFVGSNPLPFRTLYNRLRKPGNVVFIDVDAPWRKSLAGSYKRPFAGHKSREFATGAAQLGRMARCPIISCVYSLESDGAIVLEWGSPIRIACNDADSDVDVMNELIDPLELAIGERPTQYVLRIGDGRRWNSRSRRWEELTDLLVWRPS